MAPEKAKELVKKIVAMTASYASLAAAWDIKEEDDIDDYEGELLRILTEENV